MLYSFINSLFNRVPRIERETLSEKKNKLDHIRAKVESQILTPS